MKARNEAQSFRDMPIPIDPARQSQLIAFARGAIARGEMELGERVCREMHEAGWETWQTWLCIASVANSVGRGDVAIDSAERASALPGVDRVEIEKLQVDAKGADGRTRMGGVHVIRSWGQGFWSDVDHVIGQLLVAEICGRGATVLWGVNSRFRDADAGPSQRTNAWENFFEPVSAGIAGDKFFPPKWNAGNLEIAENGAFSGPGSRIAALPFFARDENVTVSDFHAPAVAVRHWLHREHPLFRKDVGDIYKAMVAKYVKPRKEIKARVDEALRTLAIGDASQPVIAVHVRGSDKAVEMGDMRPVHAAYHAEIARLMQRLGPATRVLLLTDWEPASREYRAKYGKRIIETDSIRTDGKIGLHFQKQLNGRRLGEDVLFDTLLGARCDAMLGLAYSNVSLFMSYFAGMRGMPPERIVLLGPNQHLNYNSFLLRRG